MTRAGQTGSIAVETAIVTPALLALMLLIVYAGRAAQADADVRVAAARAARAAATAADPATATDLARTAAAANLHTAGIGCQQTTVRLDTTALTPGGTVTVTVACRLANTRLALLAIPGTRWSIATATQPIDTYRAGP